VTKINYGSFGLRYWVGTKVFHLAAEGAVLTLCGLSRLGLVGKRTPHDNVCRNCRRNVTMLKARRRKIAVYRGYSRFVEAHVEVRG
jgi:hypothetical protein